MSANFESQSNQGLASRQANILAALIREHVATAQPVGSQAIVERAGLGVSPATVRNDMVQLEELGYVESPHTSAGRVPTEKGYRYYISHFLNDSPLADREQQELNDIWKGDRERSMILKETAKALAHLSMESVFLALNRNELYYTGLANLFSQPEFREHDVMSRMSHVIDQLDDSVAKVFDTAPDNVVVMVGSQNPFSESCSVILGQLSLSDGSSSLFGMLGPLRMDYDKNVARLRFIQDSLNEMLL